MATRDYVQKSLKRQSRNGSLSVARARSRWTGAVVGVLLILAVALLVASYWNTLAPAFQATGNAFVAAWQWIASQLYSTDTALACPAGGVGGSSPALAAQMREALASMLQILHIFGLVSFALGLVSAVLTGRASLMLGGVMLLLAPGILSILVSC